MSDFKPSMSDEAVKAKTGHTWAEWFAILDDAGAMNMSHKEIVAYLSKIHKVGSWWQQMVTVTYEQARGLRDKYQSATGYQVSVSRTFSVPLDKLFTAWQDDSRRAQWLPAEDATLARLTPLKSMRLHWKDGTPIDVNFYARGEAKSQVQLQHQKLPTAGDVEPLRAYWANILNRLGEFLNQPDCY